jgi:hypothetical protein
VDGELESILKEVEATRRRSSTPADRPPAEPRPGSGGVVIEPPVSKPPSGKLPIVKLPTPAQDAPGSQVRFENDIDVETPGEMKIRTFRFDARSIAAMALGIVALYLWVTSPGGLDAFRPGRLPGSYLEASSRWAMVLTAERIDQFMLEKSRLPNDLDELGPHTTDLITYERTSPTEYRLQAPGERRALELTPRTDRQAFLGSSVDILRLGPDHAP